MAKSSQKTNPLQCSVLVAVCLTAAFLFGCRSVVRPVSSPVALPERFGKEGDLPLPDKWWLSFHDPQLNALIEEAVGGNFTIRSAWDRLSQAEAVAAQAGAALLPEAEIQAGATRSGRETSNQRTYSTEYTLGLGASYELDLWGRVQSSQQAAVLDAQAARDDVTAAAITLSTNVAKTWYQLVEAKKQEALVRAQRETNEQVLEIITVQFRQGQAGAAEVFRQRQLVQSSRGQLIQIQETITLLQHQLSILLGRNPDLWWRNTSAELADLPPLPETGVPSLVLQQRPDIAAAYKAVQAADRRMAAAIADQWPRLGLSASAETSGQRIEELFDDWLAGLAANAAGPLFDAGYRKAEVQRRGAMLSQAIHEYAQAILQALRETADALSQEAAQQAYIENLQAQLTLARQVLETTRESYLQGQLDYLRVLDALVSLQSLERNELAARRALLERRIDLCRALAGGWEMDRPAQANLSEPTKSTMQ